MLMFRQCSESSGPAYIFFYPGTEGCRRRNNIASRADTTRGDHVQSEKQDVKPLELTCADFGYVISESDITQSHPGSSDRSLWTSKIYIWELPDGLIIKQVNPHLTSSRYSSRADVLCSDLGMMGCANQPGRFCSIGRRVTVELCSGVRPSRTWRNR